MDTSAPPHLSQITDHLYVSAWPEPEHLAAIQAANIRLIITMNVFRPHPSVTRPPVRLVHIPCVDSFLTPIPLRALRYGVAVALPVMQEGFGVLTHCRVGAHRSVVMACAILIAQGYTADEAMRLVKQKRALADPDTWYIRRQIRAFEQAWTRPGSPLRR